MTINRVKNSRFAISIIFLISGLSNSSWAPLVPFAQARLGLDDAELGFELLAFGLGALVMMPLTHRLIRLFGSKNVIGAAGVLLILNLPLLAIAATPLTLGLSLFAFGMEMGAINVSVNAQAVALEEKSKNILMSRFHCLYSLGGLLGAFFISTLLEAGRSVTFSIVSMSVLLTFLLTLQFRNLLTTNEDLIDKTSDKKSSIPPKIWLLGFLCFICFLAEGSMLDWSAIVLITNHGYSPASAGIGYAVFSIAMAFGRIIGDSLNKKWGALTMTRLGSLLCALGFIFTVNVPHFQFLGFILIGLGASNIVPIIFSASGRLTEGSASLGLTIVTTFGYSGLLLGPAFIGFLAEATSLTLALSSVTLLLIFLFFSSPLVINRKAATQIN